MKIFTPFAFAESPQTENKNILEHQLEHLELTPRYPV